MATNTCLEQQFVGQVQSTARNRVDGGEAREGQRRADQIALLLDVNGLDDAQARARTDTQGALQQVLRQQLCVGVESLIDTCQCNQSRALSRTSFNSRRGRVSVVSATTVPLSA